MRILIALVFIFSTAGGQALTGPGEVTGTLGGSVSVECSYEAEYGDYSKYWCRGTTRLVCDKLVKTSISEREVTEGRVTIRDSPQTRSFTVVMERLRPEDAGSYWCGIDRTASLDHMVPVSVVVLRAPIPLPPTTISAMTASSFPTTTPSTSSNTPSITSTETSGTCCVQHTLDPVDLETLHDHQPHPTRPHTLSRWQRSSDWIVLYLLPAGAFLLILLLLTAGFLIRSQRKKKKAFNRSSSPNNGPMQAPDRETAGSQGVSYADIQFEEAEQQQDVYINMQVIRKDPSLECEYDTVRV
ncbi:CMRF35-like molecule 8 [Lissotriton helveticus]